MNDFFSTPIFKRFSSHAQETLRRAVRHAEASVEPIDIIHALITAKGSIGAEILHVQATSLPLPTRPTGDTVSVSPFSPKTKLILQQSAALAYSSGHSYIGTEHVLWACLRSNDLTVKNFLAEHRIEPEKIRDHLINAMKGTSKFPDFARLFAPPGQQEPAEVNDATPALDFFGVDLTHKASTGAIDPLIGRDEEISRVITILSRRKKNNPVLLGDPGVGKTAIVEGIAVAMVGGHVPRSLLGKRIVQIDLGSLISGTQFRGEFESRIRQLIDELREHPEVIVFIDEIHMLVGAGSAQGAMDAANLLKPALARGEIRCIGATTPDEYRQYIEKDAALDRRLQPVEVNEPTPAATLEMLRGLAKTYATHHRVSFSPEALRAAVDFSVRYITDKRLPDKAIDLIDEAAASKTALRKPTRSERLIYGLEKKVTEIKHQKEHAVQEEKFAEALSLQQIELELKRDVDLAKKSLVEKEAPIVSPADVAAIISRSYRIPVEHVLGSQSHMLAALPTRLGELIKGQDKAIALIASSLQRSVAGLTPRHRPIGSFLLLGPSGVGKTATAKAIATTVFGDPAALIRFDMSEFAEGYTVSKLLGSPAGYIGHDQGGALAKAIRRRPYSVILFDEIEKAHRDVSTLLLQVLDEGSLTDASGKKIDFRNTIIILTSNAESDRFRKTRSLGFGNDSAAATSSDVLAALPNYFRPELLARLDHILIYEPLTAGVAASVAQLELDQLADRLRASGHELRIGAGVVAHIAAHGLQVREGARAMHRYIREHIETPLATQVLSSTAPRVFSLTITRDTITIKPLKRKPAPKI